MDYMMETFPIVKRKDKKLYGEYRTKRVILEMYDEMRRAMETGEVYRTRLVPGPGDRRWRMLRERRQIFNCSDPTCVMREEPEHLLRLHVSLDVLF